MKLTHIILIAALILTSGTAYSQNSENPTMYITSVSWSHDGSRIAVAGVQPPGEHGYFHVIDIQTNQILYEWTAPNIGFSSLDWSPSDDFIAIGSYDSSIYIVETTSYDDVAVLKGHKSTVTEINWNYDGTQLVSSGNWDGLTILWDMVTYNKIRDVEAGGFFPVAARFSPDGQRIAVAGEYGLRIYPSEGLTNENLGWYLKAKRNVGAFAWSDDGKRIALGTQMFIEPGNQPMAEVYILDSRTGTELARWLTEDISISDIAWDSTKNMIATVSTDNRISVWDTESKTPLERYDASYTSSIQYPRDFSLSPYGGQLAYGGTLPINPSDQITSAEKQSDSEALDDGAFHIVVPAPSLERLENIEASCVPEKSRSRLSSVESLTTDTAALTSYIDAVNADPSIPAACAADLIAVAEALQTHP